MDSQLASGPSSASSGSGSGNAASGMAPTSLLVGLAAAGAGALVWAAVSYFTGREVGYVAWGLGLLVGMATAKFGGRGMASACAAAVLTVAGIAGGKLLGTRFFVEKGVAEVYEATFTPELHAELVRDADDFAELDGSAGDAELRQFMFEHNYGTAGSADDVPEEELQAFLAIDAPQLRELHSQRLSFEDWRAQRIEEDRRAFDEEFSIVQASLDELGPIDLVFVVLGVTTAFGVARRAADQGSGPTGDQEARKAA